MIKKSLLLNHIRFICGLLCTAAILSLSACGGGTDGTGQSSSSVSGVIRTQMGAVAGVNVALLDSDGEIFGAGLSGADGSFIIADIELPDQYSLQLQGAGLNVTSLPIDTTSQSENLTVTVDPVNNAITEITKTEPTPTPTSQASTRAPEVSSTPAINPTSNPVATLPPGVSPTAVPTSAAPTAQPTAAPTLCGGPGCSLNTPAATATATNTPNPAGQIRTQTPTSTPAFVL